MEAEQVSSDDRLEEQSTETADASMQDGLQLQKEKHEQVQKILAGVRQNFGKINVAPEFSEEDLVPVEMPDLDLSESDEDEEAGGSEEEEEERDEGENVEEPEKEQESGEAEDGKELSADGLPAKAEGKSAREVNRELDEKISKLKHFLDRAKSKRFSAIRSVYPFVFFSLYAFLCSNKVV